MNLKQFQAACCKALLMSIHNTTITEIEYDGIENIAGYIAFKVRAKESLGAPTSQQNNATYSWTDHISKGGLYKPNPDFLKKIYELEQVFFDYNGSELKCGPNYIKTLINKSNHVNCSHELKSLYFRCKMFFRIRILNRSIIESQNSKKRKINKIVI